MRRTIIDIIVTLGLVLGAQGLVRTMYVEPGHRCMIASGIVDISRSLEELENEGLRNYGEGILGFTQVASLGKNVDPPYELSAGCRRLLGAENFAEEVIAAAEHSLAGEPELIPSSGH